MTAQKHRPRGSTRPGLTYRGIDFCDRCGAPLTPSEALAGVCQKHTGISDGHR